MSQKRSFSHIAKLVKHRRVSHPNNYSQSDLSNLLGYKNGQFISNVERALCNIPLKVLAKIAKILDIPPVELKQAILKDHEATIDHYLESELFVAPSSNNETVVETKTQEY